MDGFMWLKSGCGHLSLKTPLYLGNNEIVLRISSSVTVQNKTGSHVDSVYVCVCAQSCPTLCDPMDCKPPDSPVHGNFQARTLKRVAIS